eukprot:2418057-Alexandrium_andersonii.AAC.1
MCIRDRASSPRAAPSQRPRQTPWQDRRKRPVCRARGRCAGTTIARQRSWWPRCHGPRRPRAWRRASPA